MKKNDAEPQAHGVCLDGNQTPSITRPLHNASTLNNGLLEIKMPSANHSKSTAVACILQNVDGSDDALKEA